MADRQTGNRPSRCNSQTSGGSGTASSEDRGEGIASPRYEGPLFRMAGPQDLPVPDNGNLSNGIITGSALRVVGISGDDHAPPTSRKSYSIRPSVWGRTRWLAEGRCGPGQSTIDQVNEPLKSHIDRGCNLTRTIVTCKVIATRGYETVSGSSVATIHKGEVMSGIGKRRSEGRLPWMW